MTRIAMVVAVSKNGVIGSNGRLPWHISAEIKLFKALTIGKPIIMGRKTWESLPKRPLPDRQNIVLTRQKNYGATGAAVVNDVDAALAAAGNVEEIAVIGGAEIYRMFFPLAARIYLTEVDLEVAGDTYFPALAADEWQETARQVHAPGPGDSAGFTLRTLERLK